VPAGDLDVVDEQPEELLFLAVVEVVDDGADAGGEVLDTAAELVAFGEFGALGGEAGPLAGDLALAGGDGGGAALELGHVDQAGLVEVDQAVALGAGGVELAVQAGELGGEQFVVGDGRVEGDGLIRSTPPMVALATSVSSRMSKVSTLFFVAQMTQITAQRPRPPDARPVQSIGKTVTRDQLALRLHLRGI
jgi:hypothetical protein